MGKIFKIEIVILKYVLHPAESIPIKKISTKNFVLAILSTKNGQI